MAKRRKRLFKKRFKKKLKMRVYTAFDRARRRRVIVKRNPNVREVRHEYRTLKANQKNPYVVRLIRCRVRRRFGRRVGYLILERVRGRTIRQLLKRRPKALAARAVPIALNLLKAVELLHRSGYVHGDLHAGNVLVTDLQSARVKLIDFQHAVRVNARGRARARRTLPKPPAHLAPETRRRTIDRRYDIYGVGFILGSMLLGREPARRRALWRRREPRRLWAVVRAAIRKSPARRFRSAEEMRLALEAAARGEP